MVSLISSAKLKSACLIIGICGGHHACKQRGKTTLYSDPTEKKLLGIERVYQSKATKSSSQSEAELKELNRMMNELPHLPSEASSARTHKTPTEYILVGGDMIIPKEDLTLLVDPENLEGDPERPADGANGLNLGSFTSNNRRWPSGIVPYTISDDLSAADQAQFLEAVAEINGRMNVRFLEFDPAQHVRWLQVRKNMALENECNASVGLHPNPAILQVLMVGRIGCDKAAFVHEMLHVLGLFHTQSRRDRDDFVEIFESHIMPAYRFAYARTGRGWVGVYGEDVGTYDFESIMHYGDTWFCSKNSAGACLGYTMRKKSDGGRIIPHDELSPGDIATINAKYPDPVYSRWTRNDSQGRALLVDYFTARISCHETHYRLPLDQWLRDNAESLRTLFGSDTCVWGFGSRQQRDDQPVLVLDSRAPRIRFEATQARPNTSAGGPTTVPAGRCHFVCVP